MDRLHERFLLFLHLNDEITGLKAFKAALWFNSHNLMDAYSFVKCAINICCLYIINAGDW